MLFRKAANWIWHRLKIRYPLLFAKLLRELPLQPVTDLYTAAPRAQARIPNVVYQTWISDKLGRSHAASLRRFRELNADHSFQFFDDAKMESYMLTVFGDQPIYDAFRRTKYGPMKADIWRYCILFERGGVYCDIGKGLSRPIRDFVGAEDAGVISWERRNLSRLEVSEKAAAVLQYPERRVINWLLGFSPRHPVMRRAIEGIAANLPAFADHVAADPKEAIIALTGPVWLTKCVIDTIEAGEFDAVRQCGIEFDGAALWELRGAWVRYVKQKTYALEKNRRILH